MTTTIDNAIYILNNIPDRYVMLPREREAIKTVVNYIKDSRNKNSSLNETK